MNPEINPDMNLDMGGLGKINFGMYLEMNGIRGKNHSHKITIFNQNNKIEIGTRVGFRERYRNE